MRMASLEQLDEFRVHSVTALFIRGIEVHHGLFYYSARSSDTALFSCSMASLHFSSVEFQLRQLTARCRGKVVRLVKVSEAYGRNLRRHCKGLS